jgi:energy-coupling factor transporter ATP-binding protein EcfA2
VPEREISFSYLTGRQFVRANADLHGMKDAGAATERALARVDLVEPAGRRIDTYSKGMRQRAKIAAALVHGPGVMLLDEPFNGVDPRQRMQLMELLREMGEQGHTILFSSHILEEVERLARHIEVVVSGRHAASGDFGAIRRLMTDRPVQYFLRSDDDRALAIALVGNPSVRAVRFADSGGLDVEVLDLGSFVHGLPLWARARRHLPPRGLSQRRISRECLLLLGGPMNTTISRLALAALVGRKRFVLLLLFPLAMIALTVLVRVLTSDPVAAQETLFGLGLLLVLPLLCLVGRHCGDGSGDR